jgi:hypothetical protein
VLLAIVEENGKRLLEETRTFVEGVEDIAVLQRLMIDMCAMGTFKQGFDALEREHAALQSTE